MNDEYQPYMDHLAACYQDYDPNDKSQFWSNDNPYPTDPRKRNGCIVYDPRWEDIRDTEEWRRKR